MKHLYHLLIIVVLGATPNTFAEKQQMNVLFLIIDDLNTWLLGDENRYRGKVIAPNITKLGKSGIVFQHAYTASPVCAPSRTALWSGMRPWQTGVYQNGVDSRQSKALKKATSLPKLFKQAGYFTASHGKVTHGWDTRSGFDERTPHRRDPIPPNAPFLSFTRGEQDWGPTHLTEEEMNDTKYADATIKLLQREHERPFFIACGLFHPHMPWYVPQKYFDMFPLSEVTIPPIKKNDLDDIPTLGREITQGKSKFVDQVVAHGLHKEGVQAYLATTAYADAQIGRVLDALDKSPYKNSTLVVLFSDHGFHLGEKNHWQKGTLWEEATNCLLMFRVPGVTRPNLVSQRLVSLQDIYPTLTQLCNVKTPDYVEGRSLLPLLKDPNAKWKSTAITTFSNRYATIRTKSFRYIRYTNAQEEFYDLRSDPNQWTNEINSQEYKVIIDNHRSLLPDFAEMITPIPRKRK